MSSSSQVSTPGSDEDPVSDEDLVDEADVMEIHESELK